MYQSCDLSKYNCAILATSATREIEWDGCLYSLNKDILVTIYSNKGANMLQVFRFSKLSEWNSILESEMAPEYEMN